LFLNLPNIFCNKLKKNKVKTPNHKIITTLKSIKKYSIQTTNIITNKIG